MVRSLAFLALFIPTCWGAQADALAISQNIQARHVPFGTIIDPVYASSTSDQIVGYTRCGDSAIWTGHYLAAEAFRYKVTGAADALTNVQNALNGLKLLTDVTGTNLLARCAVPLESNYMLGIAQEESANGVYFGSSADGHAYMWIGNTSRDEYLGAFFGAGVAYDMISDPATKAQIAALVSRWLDYLEEHLWTLLMPDLSISTTFVIRPDQQLALLQIGRHINSSKYNSTYQKLAGIAPAVIAPIAVDAADVRDSYFKFNLDYLTFYILIELEDSSFRKLIYKSAYGVLRDATGTHENAHFNMIDRAIRGANTGRDFDTQQFLSQWLTRPKRDPYVDLRGQFPSCVSSDQSCNPIPVPLRVPTDFLWQRSPFQLDGGGSGTIEGAGIDYILPYWMARYFGVETN